MHGQFLARLYALAIGALASAAAPGAAPLPIGEAVSAVAANESGGVALTRDQVRIMDGTGFPVARLPRDGARGQPAPHRRQAPRAGAFAAGAGVLDDGDFNDPHDPDSEIEDPENILAEDDAPVRRHARTVASPTGVVLAVGGAFAWVGRDDGLWRLAFRGGAERAALPGGGPARAVAASADGRVVVGALDDGLALSKDGGDRFERVADAPARVTRLAVTDDGRVYALSGEGLHQLAGAAGMDVIVSGAEDVVSCGNAALVLARRRISVLPGTGTGALEAAEPTEPTEQSPLVPLGAERLACAPDGTVWIAYGASLWISEDRGKSWTPRDDVPAAFAINGVAATRSSLWVASGVGLAVLPLRPESGPEMASGSAPPPAAGGLAVDVDSWPRRSWWLAALPLVDLGFATARSNARREVRAFVLFSFTFDPRRDRRAERQLDADVRAAELREATQRWLTRDARGAGRLDPIAAEERDATLRLLGD